MLQLRYLFDNRDLAEMILKYWEYDPEKRSLMDRYRISSNAVYPFEYAGERRYLRFSPVEAGREASIGAEIEFIRYLRNEGYPAAGIIGSRAGKEVERIRTPWGEYLAVVFQGAPGKRFDWIIPSDELIAGYGQALGRLHELSRRYTKVRARRESWRDQCDRIRAILAGFPEESAAREEETIIRSCLERLPVTGDNYGLVHYDFEPDNVFYDESEDCFHVIDFDDAVYHWYTLDIDQSIDNLVDRMMPDRGDEVRDLFLEGYTSVCPIDTLLLSAVPVFRRYANLYSYVRFLRATVERWENEPDWMKNLRGILDNAMQSRRALFGMPLPTIVGCQEG